MTATEVANRTSVSSTNDWRKDVQIRLMLVDALCILAAVGIAFVAKFGRPKVDSLSNLEYFWVAVGVCIAWIIAMIAAQTYRADALALGAEEFRRVTKATFAVFGLFAIFSLIFRFDISRTFLAVALPVGLALLLLGRLLGRVVLNRARANGRCIDPALIIGAPMEVRYVADRIQATPSAGYAIAGVGTGEVDADQFELADGQLVTEIGAIDSPIRDATELGATTIIIAGHSRVDREYLRDLSWNMEGSGISLVLASRMTDVAGPRIHWRPIEGLPLMGVETPTYTGLRFYVKRLFDFTLALFATVVLAPVLLVLAVAIKIDSKGPVFFRQTRVGVNGSHFKITKFRSMVVDAEARLAALQAESGGAVPLFKVKDDPRITRVGHFIRRWSLDELPQFFDVLAGSMSLVGPRPQVPAEVEVYEDHFHRRLNVKPGITGPWQVGGRSNLSWEECIRKDLYYVENWSLAGDVVILLKTVRAVLMRDGAF